MTTDTIVTEAFARLEQAWNDADGNAFGAPFTVDADFVDIRGSRHHGAAAIAAGHQAIFDSIYRGSHVGYSLTDSASLASGCVLGLVDATLDVPTGPLTGTQSSTITAVLVDEAGTWRIRAFHNTLVSG
ncbi:MAG: hypothetical protein AVDCRST_MAG76-3693 [uncultured Acidimicrobiales bacterium]|uniref:DUF4440 domain-containing protein n=1 Tax=uncultured Acidimicrobiales bacterium TaxID=310071 RepID=A0A6J4JCN0_9ACTN|nr:MAG: hypothetical protein AVDCRST_MAG76-3693 [uncultured Acidimicrobiales bacterium]